MFDDQEIALLINAFSEIHWEAYTRRNTRMKDLERVMNMLREKAGFDKTDYSNLREK